MSWDTMQKTKQQSGGKLFVKLADGESIEGTFMGDP